MQSLCRLQTRVVFGSSEEAVSPCTKFTKIGFQKALDNHSSWSRGARLWYLKQAWTALLHCSQMVSVMLWFFFCKTQIIFLLTQASKASKQERERRKKKKIERKYCLAIWETAWGWVKSTYCEWVGISAFCWQRQPWEGTLTGCTASDCSASSNLK